MTHESHATRLDRNELGALLVAAGLGSAAEHALTSLLALNGLRVSEATSAHIQALGVDRGVARPSALSALRKMTHATRPEPDPPATGSPQGTPGLRSPDRPSHATLAAGPSARKSSCPAHREDAPRRCVRRGRPNKPTRQRRTDNLDVAFAQDCPPANERVFGRVSPHVTAITHCDGHGLRIDR